MTGLVRSELLKIRTTRGWWAYLIVLVGLVGIGSAAEVGSRSVDERSGLDFQFALVDLVGIASLLAIILGITIVTTEFRHGTITPTLLATPGRERMLAGKAIAGVLVAIFFAVLAFAVIGTVAAVWVSIDGGDLQLADSDVAARAVKTLVGVVLWLLLGVVIGAVVQSQVAALVGTLVWLFLVETLLVGLSRSSTPTASPSTCPSTRSTAPTAVGATTCSTTGLRLPSRAAGSSCSAPPVS